MYLAPLSFDQGDKKAVSCHFDNILRDHLVALFHQAVEFDKTPVFIEKRKLKAIIPYAFLQSVYTCKNASPHPVF